MNSFFALLEQIISFADEIAERNEVHDVYYRGHNRCSYKLLPGLARIKTDNTSFLENRLFFDFVQYGGHLIPPYKTTWEILYLMQHHGLPTRLLDWSESLLTALYFAIKDSDPNENAAIWALDPYGLNVTSTGQDIIDYLDIKYPSGYLNYFVDDRLPEFGSFPEGIISIGVLQPNSRVITQNATFTFHNPKDIATPLEELYPSFVKKFIIKSDSLEYAKRFLSQSKLNEFTMFPDLDGLSRHIRNIEIK